MSALMDSEKDKAALERARVDLGIIRQHAAELFSEITVQSLDIIARQRAINDLLHNTNAGYRNVELINEFMSGFIDRMIGANGYKEETEGKEVDVKAIIDGMVSAYLSLFVEYMSSSR